MSDSWYDSLGDTLSSAADTVADWTKSGASAASDFLDGLSNFGGKVGNVLNTVGGITGSNKIQDLGGSMRQLSDGTTIIQGPKSVQRNLDRIKRAKMYLKKGKISPEEQAWLDEQRNKKGKGKTKSNSRFANRVTTPQAGSMATRRRRAD
jgi:hypothetical protein